MMQPTVIPGNHHSDERGTVRYNNSFDLSAIKRVYTLENADESICRGWQGHRVEQRWFSAVSGKFQILLIGLDDWATPSQELPVSEFILEAGNFDVLHVPAGFISHIKAVEPDSKLLVFADYFHGEIVDEYRFPADYFRNKQ